VTTRPAWPQSKARVAAASGNDLREVDVLADPRLRGNAVPITNLNHAVLFVRDLERSRSFYTDVLGFTEVMGMEGAAFLQAPGSSNDHDLGLFAIGDGAGPSAAGRSTVGLYHIAWEVDTLGELQRLAERLREVGALGGASDHATTKALYARDPDGLEFEVSWLVPADLIDDDVLDQRSSIRPLDLTAEIQRYGADTPGGVGVSRLVPGA